MTETSTGGATIRERIDGLGMSTLYLVLAIPFGLFFLFAIPPTQVLDESSHFLRVWTITDGHVVAERAHARARDLEVNAGTYPRCVRGYVDELQAQATTGRPFRVGDFWSEGPRCEDGTGRQIGTAHGGYSFWTYPGQEVGVAVGRLLSLPVPWTFYLGRLTGIAVVVALCWWAIRWAPRGKSVLAFVALVPMALSSAAGYSPDGFVLAMALVLVAAVIRWSEPGARTSTRTAVLVAVGYLAMSLSKPPYALFALLFLCCDPEVLGSRRRSLAALGGVAAVTVVLVGAWQALGTPSGAVELFYPRMDPSGQVAWIVEHPLRYLRIIGTTFFGDRSQVNIVQGWVGAFGMQRGAPDTAFIAPFYVLVAAAALGAFTASEAGERRRSTSRADRLRTWIPYGTTVLVGFGIYTAAFVAWNPVGFSPIDGVQGRYFLPLVPVLALGCIVRHATPRWSVRPVTVALVAAVVFVGGVAKVTTYFY